MHIYMLKGLIFDMDGTITLSEPLHNKAYSAIFRRYGVEFTVEEEVMKYAGSGSRNIFTKVFEERGIKVSSEEIEKCIVEKRELYKKIIQEEEIPVVPGVREFAAKMLGKGLKMIIATGNSDLESVRFVLRKVGLQEYFPNMVSVAEVARGKPFPDVFLEAGRRIGCAPQECVVFEDAINGVEAAKAAGIRCIALATTIKPEDLEAVGASIAVKNYNQITDKILYE